MTAKQIREIQIRVNTQGDKTLAKLANDFAKVSKRTQSLAKDTNILKNAFMGIQGFFAGKWSLNQLVGALDSMQKLTDRLSITEGSTNGAIQALNGLNQVANNTKTSIEDISVVYNRLHMALSDMNVSSEALIGFTETLQNTFRLSGATASEATGAVIQLSQGLASGQLRGQELRSVLEANVVIGGMLAKHFGTTRGELIKFAEKNGGLDAVGVFKALANGAVELDEKVKKLNPTISEAFTTGMNDLKVQLNEMNRQFEITKKVVTAMEWTFKNLNLILVAGTTALIAWKVRAIETTTIITVMTKAGTALSIALGAIKVGLTFLSGPAGIITTLMMALGTAIGFAYKHLKEADLKRESDKMAKYRSELYQTTDAMYDLSDANNTFVSSARVGGKVTKDMFNKDQHSFLTNITMEMHNLGRSSKSAMQAFIEASSTMTKGGKDAFNLRKSLADINKAYMEGEISMKEYKKALKEVRIDKLNEDARTGAIDMLTYNKRLHEIMDGKKKTNADEMIQAISRLNKQFVAGKITLEQYGAEVRELEYRNALKEFKAGRLDILKFNEALNTKKVQELNVAWKEGTVTFTEFRDSVNSIKLEQFRREFAMGKMSVAEFDEQLNSTTQKLSAGSALRQGIVDYMNSIGTLNTNIANGITNTFSNLENHMMNFLETGKFAFKDFAKEVLNEINRIVLRAMIIRPLAEGILNFSSPSASAGQSMAMNYQGGSYSGYAEKGFAPNGTGVSMFAKGGVVNTPTPFTYNGNKRGLMGEAGPEAIIPLKRDSSGRLGVDASGAGSNVVVNVINNSDSVIEQRETTNQDGSKQIDILIVSKVKEHFAKGTFDRTMADQYGVKRRGR